MRYLMRYFVVCEHENSICGEHNSIVGRASTIKSAKSIICKIRKGAFYVNPHNFKIFDSFGDVDEQTNFVPCVYFVEK